jgi:hypothetical protein
LSSPDVVMDEIAPEYDVVVLGTGRNDPARRGMK